MNTQEIEKRWKTFWKEQDVYKVSNDTTKPKYYVLDMFPYPSGAGLHVGHPLGYVASDIYARFKRMSGFNVLHPMGYDAFGLPAEQYAIDTGVHPADSTADNIAMYRKQLDNLGFSFDWSREVQTCDPKFYKWTQWIFLKLFNHYYDNDLQKAQPISTLADKFAKGGSTAVNAANSMDNAFTAEEWNAFSKVAQQEVLMNYRLVYKKKSYVNWCAALGTVLSHDEVKDGVSERGGHPVERKPLMQWSLRTTAYAERLLTGLDTVNWPDSMKKMQANWIGKSIGAQMFFDIKGSASSLEIFTTRPDTIFGATFMVLAPEHSYVDDLTTAEQKGAIDEYIKYVNTRSERDRQSDVKTVTGAFTGSYAINPFTGQEIPIWIAEYVLADYGTGAIMAVPSDDDRDFAFAKKFDIPIVEVIDKSKYPNATRHDKLGIMINSGFMNGMEVPDAIKAALQQIEDKGIGKKQVNYKLRDGVFGRQRYWGEPFPIVYDKEGIAYPVAEAELPVELPQTTDFKPSPEGISPLGRVDDWVNLEGGFKRETDTMPGYAGSSWYFLRYMDAGNTEEFASKKAIDYWQNVDLYIGGTEHAVGHLLYSRTWNKFLYDLGLVTKDEPFDKLVNQGMIQGIIENIYLHKEKRAFISAELAKAYESSELAELLVHASFVSDYGLEDSYLSEEGIAKFKEWREDYKDFPFIKAEGSDKFYTKSEIGKMSKSKFNVVNPDDVVAEYGADCFRMYEMFLGPLTQSKPWNTKGIDGVSRFLKKFWYLFFDKENKVSVSDEAATREEMKILHQTIKKVTTDIERLSLNTCISAFMVATNELHKANVSKRAVLDPMVRLMAPFAPFIAEELWHILGHEESVHWADYPVLDESYLVEDSKTYPIAFNGKTRLTVDFPATATKEELEKAVLEVEGVNKWIEGKAIRKIIVVPGRMINIVVS